MTIRQRFHAAFASQHVAPGIALVGAIAGTIAGGLVGGCEVTSPEGTLREAVSFGANPGNLTMYEYVPAGLPSEAPLVVVMHGCSQTATEYFHNAGWDQLADEHGFALVMPEQNTGNNSGRCFNWFESSDNRRGQGEARSIASMVDAMLGTYQLDANRVFATGLSAGGAMTAVMMATYPEKFAGGAIMAGVVYGCANGLLDSFSCMSSPSGSPGQWGDAVRNASSHTGPWPVVSIWHGTSDYTVGYGNLQESLEQWTNVHGIDQTVDATGSAGNGARAEYRDANGITRVETWSIDGMGHATAVDPGTLPGQCGVAGAFMSDENVCSSYEVISFWGIAHGGGSEPDAGPVGEPDAGPVGEPDAGPVGEPDASPGDPPDADPGNGHVCTESTSNNYLHVQLGRAYHSLGYTYAVGSGDAMGLYNVFYENTLAETAPGYFEVGTCP